MRRPPLIFLRLCDAISGLCKAGWFWLGMIATTITTRYSFLLMLSKKPKLALISCSGRKGKTPAPARFLYTGALFKKSLAFAEREYDHSVILSAKHGLLELDDVVEPYDQTLQRMPRPKREEWAQRVSEQIKSRYDGWSYVYLAGKTN
jgi:hypothetical protein